MPQLVTSYLGSVLSRGWIHGWGSPWPGGSDRGSAVFLTHTAQSGQWSHSHLHTRKSRCFSLWSWHLHTRGHPHTHTYTHTHTHNPVILNTTQGIRYLTIHSNYISDAKVLEAFEVWQSPQWFNLASFSWYSESNALQTAIISDSPKCISLSKRGEEIARQGKA